MKKSSKEKKQRIEAQLLGNPTQAISSAWVAGLLGSFPECMVDLERLHANGDGCNLSGLSAEMRGIIKDAYSLFGNYSAPARFNVCTHCCMSVEEELALRTIPLPLLSRGVIYSYNDSAKGELDSKDEVAYLLPRILELIALGEEIHHSPEFYLGWVAKVPSEQWTQQEKELLERFALQYTKDVFVKARQERMVVEVDSILAMFSIAGINIEAVLVYMAQSADFYVVASIAYLLGYSSKEKVYITNVFVDDCPELNGQFTLWLEGNMAQLGENASHAILHPEALTGEPDHVKYCVELGLVELSDFRGRD